MAQQQYMTEREINDIVKANKLLQHDLDSTRHQLEETHIKLKQLQEINTNYTSDLKIQKRIQSKLKKELEMSEMNRKQTAEALEAEKQKLELAANKQNELENALRTQQSEALVAQKAIDNMHKEINDLTSTKEATEKQWSEAITAMSKRDRAFQTVEDVKVKLVTENLEAMNRIRVIQIERDEALKKLAEKEAECETVQRTLVDLRLVHKSTIEKYSEARNNLIQAETAESLYKQELDQLKKVDELKTTELDKKVVAMHTLKSRVNLLKADFEEKMRLHVPVDQAMRREEVIKQQAAAEVKIIAREEETKNINLRRDNAQLQMALDEKTEQMLQLQGFC
eukprot:jgi/Hompol1/6093/HPOL_000353-RA